MRRVGTGRGRHARALLALLILVALVAVVAVAGSQPSPRHDMKPTAAQLCRNARYAFARRAATPEIPFEVLEKAAHRACDKASMPMVTTMQPRIPATPGCNLAGTARAGLPDRGRIAAPTRAVPFYAPRPGELPPNGTPVVAGIRLPRGSRCQTFWSTDAGVRDVVGLARRLAGAFPSTGLWPVVWDADDDMPDAHVRSPADPVAADRLSAAALLRAAARRAHPHAPGLRPAPAAKRVTPAPNPFGATARGSLSLFGPPGGLILMLVPVQRPADVVSVLGMENTRAFRDVELTAILRSWEERFDAVVVALAPHGVDLVVGSAKLGPKQARQVAEEHLAVSPNSGYTRATLPKALRRAPTGDTSRSYWRFGWRD